MSQTKVCVVCQKEVSTMITMPQRPIFAPCGLPKFLCQSCQDEGWISLSGTGGGDALYNEALNLEIVKGQMLPYDRVRSDDDDDEP